MANNNNNNLISSSKYDIFNKSMAIAEHYFGDNVDYMRSGFFAYNAELMSMFIRDSAIHNTMLYNESYLNTAIMPKSVYNWAKMFNIQIPNATPAYADIMLSINTAELDTMMSKRRAEDSVFTDYGLDVSSLGSETNVFVIDRTNQIISGDYYFALERSIIIYKNVNGSYVVRYCTTQVPNTTTFGNMDTIFLKTVLTSSEGETYLSFIVRAWQYKIVSITKQITSNSFIDSKIHSFEFDDQLAGIRLRYKKNNKIEPIPLIFSDSIVNSEEKYAYYTLVDTNKVQIKFINGVFLPSVGGTLLVDIYTSYGAGGNTTFTGDAVMKLSDEAYRTLAITATFTDYKSTGGIDTPSLSALKSNIIKEISSKDVIVTEGDLKTYFDGLTYSLSGVNDGKIEFKKCRDDLIRRMYNVYILMRDGLDESSLNNASEMYRSRVIPTNTIDVSFPITNNISKPFGSLARQVIDGNKVTYEYVPMELEENDEYYAIPFYMRVVLSPIKKVKYIYNITNDSSALAYESIIKSGKGIITPSSVSVVRGIDGTNAANRYTFTFAFATNYNLSSVWGNNDVTLWLYKSKNAHQSINIPYNSTPTETECGLQVISEQVQGSDVYNSYIIVSVPVANDEFDFTESDDYGTYINLNTGSGNVKLPEDAYVGLALNVALDTETLEMTFKSDEPLALFKNLDNIMDSDIVVNTTKKYYQTRYFVASGDSAVYKKPNGDRITNADIKNTANNYTLLYTTTAEVDEDDADGYDFVKEVITSIKIKEVPVVHTSFFNDDVNRTKFIKQLFIYIDMLKNNLSKLETNTYFNLKFFNTHGLSNRYSMVNTNIDLALKIWLKPNSENKKNTIRDYIRVIIDKSNNDKALRISEILTLTTAAYSKYIDHIDFIGLNGTFDQYIKEVETNSLVPEYFNLDANTIDNIQFAEIGSDD